MAELEYNVLVHVHEVRDLVGRNSNGMSDPYCVVSMFGQTFRTSVLKNRVNVLYDRRFVFDKIKLTERDFNRQAVHVQIFDANVIATNELIGITLYDIILCP